MKRLFKTIVSLCLISGVSVLGQEHGTQPPPGSISLNGLTYPTLTAAVAAANALHPSAAAPAEIILGRGAITASTNIAITNAFITIRGGGQKATIISFIGTNNLTIAASNVLLYGFTLARSGASGSNILTTTVHSLFTYLPGVRLEELSVENTNGIAVGTFSGDANGCNFMGKTAVDWLYGGKVFHCKITGHDPALTAITYCIATAQSIAASGGVMTYDVQENDLRRRCFVQGCKIQNTDPNGICVNGVTESDVGDRLASDWYYQNVTLSLGTQPAVSWYPITLAGCEIYGPALRQGGTTNNAGALVRTNTGTGACLRGTLDVHGCDIYGSYCLSYVHDSIFTGGNITTESNDHKAMEHVHSTAFNSVYFILGNARLGTIDGLPRVQLDSGNMFTACQWQGETEEVLRGNQYQLIFCTQYGFDGIVGPVGFYNKDPLAVRLRGSSCGYFITESTKDYSATNLTFECWFRTTNSASDVRLLDYSDGGVTTHYMSMTVKPSAPGQMYCYIGGVQIINITSGLNFTNGAWHHVAMTVTNGTGVVYYDGVSKGTNTGCTFSPGTDTSTFRIGGAAGDFNTFDGDIAEVRVSSNVRYVATFTPQTHFTTDANTLGLWSDTTRKYYTWTDQVGRHDATNTDGSNGQHYWVPIARGFTP